jgi:hypothetical protein
MLTSPSGTDPPNYTTLQKKKNKQRQQNSFIPNSGAVSIGQK